MAAHGYPLTPRKGRRHHRAAGGWPTTPWSSTPAPPGRRAAARHRRRVLCDRAGRFGRRRRRAPTSAAPIRFDGAQSARHRHRAIHRRFRRRRRNERPVLVRTGSCAAARSRVLLAPGRLGRWCSTTCPAAQGVWSSTRTPRTGISSIGMLASGRRHGRHLLGQGQPVPHAAVRPLAALAGWAACRWPKNASGIVGQMPMRSRSRPPDDEFSGWRCRPRAPARAPRPGAAVLRHAHAGRAGRPGVHRLRARRVGVPASCACGDPLPTWPRSRGFGAQGHPAELAAPIRCRDRSFAPKVHGHTAVPSATCSICRSHRHRLQADRRQRSFVTDAGHARRWTPRRRRRSRAGGEGTCSSVAAATSATHGRPCRPRHRAPARAGRRAVRGAGRLAGVPPRNPTCRRCT